MRVCAGACSRRTQSWLTRRSRLSTQQCRQCYVWCVQRHAGKGHNHSRDGLHVHGTEQRDIHHRLPPGGLACNSGRSHTRVAETRRASPAEISSGSHPDGGCAPVFICFYLVCPVSCLSSCVPPEITVLQVNTVGITGLMGFKVWVRKF